MVMAILGGSGFIGRNLRSEFSIELFFRTIDREMSHLNTDVMDRRSALKWSALGAAGLFSSGQLSDLFALEDGETVIPFLDTPQSPPQRLDWANLESWLTPGPGF